MLFIEVIFLIVGILTLLNGIFLEPSSIMHQIYQQLLIMNGILLLGFSFLYTNLIRIQKEKNKDNKQN